MDDGNSGATTATENEIKPAKTFGRRAVRRIVPLALVLILAFTAGLVYMAGGELSTDGAYRAWIVLTGRAAREIDIPEGFGRAFCDLKPSVVAAGELGVTVIGPDGTETAREIAALPEAAVVSNGKLAAAYSPGGHDVIILDSSGLRARIKDEAEIRSVNIGKHGEIAIGYGAVETNNEIYKGAVKVYKLRGDKAECVYEWYSGAGYVLSAVVSSDGKTMAALTLGANGGRIAFYNLSSNYLAAEAHYAEAILEIAYADNGALWAKTRGKLLSVSSGGVITELYDCNSYETESFAADGAFAAMYLSNRTGGRLVTVDTRGRINEADGAYGESVSLRINGEQTALLTETGLYVFRDRTLAKHTTFTETGAFTDAFPRSEQTVIATGARTGLVFG